VLATLIPHVHRKCAVPSIWSIECQPLARGAVHCGLSGARHSIPRLPTADVLHGRLSMERGVRTAQQPELTIEELRQRA
jgi:hypothetical protein